MIVPSADECSNKKAVRNIAWAPDLLSSVQKHQRATADLVSIERYPG